VGIMIDVTSGAGTAHPFRPPGFQWGS
jgi:hypothetical protein